MSAPGDVKRAADGGKDLWETPPDVFRYLNDEFWFTLDGAASHENHLCPLYYTEFDNAFEQKPRGEVIYLNPPFTNLKDWVHLAREWSLIGNTVVMLTPNATESVWYQTAFRTADEERRPVRRLQFLLNGVRPRDKDGKLSGNTTGSTFWVWYPLYDRRPDNRCRVMYFDWLPE